MGPVTQDTCTASKWTVRPEIKAMNSLVMCGMVHDQAVFSIVMCGTVHGQRGASEAATERSEVDGKRAKASGASTKCLVKTRTLLHLASQDNVKSQKSP